MLNLLTEIYTQISKWSNENQGVVSLLIFGFTLIIGWASGIFSALRHKPKFRLGLIDGPTFCCTFKVGKEYQNTEVHRTGIALYLTVDNIGSAASSITNVSIGYHWHLIPFSFKWLRYSIGWFWLTRQATSLADFQVSIGENTKVYPFLFQRNNQSPSVSSTFLQAGQSTNGVVYFEQEDSWGGCFPSSKNNFVTIKVCVEDVFRTKHKAKFRIPFVTMEHARKYNPSFGTTLAKLHGEQMPNDVGI